MICVGTTSCRTIESWAEEDGTLRESAGWTNIFIYPGYRVKVLDGLITNFHLPESTLIMLVSALAGRELFFADYDFAVRERFLFFSFVEAMLIVREYLRRRACKMAVFSLPFMPWVRAFSVSHAACSELG